MKTMSAREAKNAFGLMIDTARAEPVLIEKHGRGVVGVISVEEYERLNGTANTAQPNPMALSTQALVRVLVGRERRQSDS
jgi:prevent-host-death family protein